MADGRRWAGTGFLRRPLRPLPLPRGGESQRRFGNVTITIPRSLARRPARTNLASFCTSLPIHGSHAVVPSVRLSVIYAVAVQPTLLIECFLPRPQATGPVAVDPERKGGERRAAEAKIEQTRERRAGRVGSGIGCFLHVLDWPRSGGGAHL